MKRHIKKTIVFFLIAVSTTALSAKLIFDSLKKEDSFVLATVGEATISLRDVEEGYDLKFIGSATSGLSLENVQLDYTNIIYELIESKLVSEELKRRDLAVSEQEIDAFALQLSESYIVLDEKKPKELHAENLEDFEKILTKVGIDYSVWRAELKARLEEEKLTYALAADEVVTAEEIFAFCEQNPDKVKAYEKISFFIVQSHNKEKLEKAIENNLNDVSELIDNGFYVQSLDTKLEMLSKEIPLEYLENFDKTKINAYSPIFTDSQKQYYSFYIVSHSIALQNSLEVYKYVEEILFNAKIPILYQAWLEKSLKETPVFIHTNLIPKE